MGLSTIITVSKMTKQVFHVVLEMYGFIGIALLW